MKNYVFLGASSQIAIESVAILKNLHHCSVTGISTKDTIPVYDKFYTIPKYEMDYLPHIEEELDGLVYFPGSINLKPFTRIQSNEFLQDLEINVFGAVHSIQKYFANLKKVKNSSIVLFSSVAAQVGLPFHSSIAVSKSAVEGLTKSLAAEFAPHVRCNAIAPSLTNTPLSQKLLNTEEKFELSKQRNPMNHVGSAEEIAETVSFLLSHKSSWITGQIFHVDGGMSSLRTK